MKCVLWLTGVVGIVFLCGCASENPQLFKEFSSKPAGGTVVDEESLSVDPASIPVAAVENEEIKADRERVYSDKELMLRMLGDDFTYKVGSTPEMRIRINNLTDEKVVLFGWYAKESDNFIISYRPYNEDETMESAMEAKWTLVVAQLKPKQARWSLDLGPKRFVDSELDSSFVSELEPGMYWFFVRTNHKNLPLSTDVYLMTIEE